MIKYQYQILRYIHDQITGEFANVGVVLFCPEDNFLDCKVTSRYARLSGFFREINGSFLLSNLKTFQKGIQAAAAECFKNNTKKIYGFQLADITCSILPKDDSALQLTDVLKGIDVDAEMALLDIYDRLIDKYNEVSSDTPHTDQYAWSKIYKTYFDKYGITGQLKKHAVHTEKDIIQFDKAWKNGVWNCYQALSFDLKQEDAIKSKVYKWYGIMKEMETINEETQLYFLTTSPKENTELTEFIEQMLTTDVGPLKACIINEEEAEAFVLGEKKKMDASIFQNGNDDLEF